MRPGDYGIDCLWMLQEKYQASGLRPQKRRASATVPSRRAVVYQGHCTETTSSEAPQSPCPLCRGQVAKCMVGWKAVLGNGEGQNGRRKNNPPSQCRTKSRVGGRKCSSVDSGSTARPHGFGRSGRLPVNEKGLEVEKRKKGSNEPTHKGRPPLTCTSSIVCNGKYGERAGESR